jgi:transcriptional regulator with XRE-family HTH domain
MIYTAVIRMVTNRTHLCDIMRHMTGFQDWLRVELDKRNWTYADLSERAGIGRSTVSMVMSGARNPGPEFLLGISDALNVPEIVVFQKAGLLPEDSVATPTTREANFLFRQLSDRQQEDLLRMMRALVEEKRRNDADTVA